MNWADVTGRIGRCGFWCAALLAAGLVAIGYAMDWFLFGAVGFAWPDFFTCFVGAALVLPLLTLGVRRLHDAGRSRWRMLFLFVPLAGWLLLARWWCEPSGSGASPARSRSHAPHRRIGGPVRFQR